MPPPASAPTRRDTLKRPAAYDRNWPAAGGHERLLRRCETRKAEAGHRASSEKSDGHVWVGRVTSSTSGPVIHRAAPAAYRVRPPVNEWLAGFCGTAGCGGGRQSTSGVGARCPSPQDSTGSNQSVDWSGLSGSSLDMQRHGQTKLRRRSIARAISSTGAQPTVQAPYASPATSLSTAQHAQPVGQAAGCSGRLKDKLLVRQALGVALGVQVRCNE